MGQIIAGFALCDTGIGCMLGAPLVAHGVNGTYEGGAGLYNGVMNQLEISSDLLDAFILNKDTGQVIMTVQEPETITNVKQIVDDCHLVITITGDNEDVPAYYVCKRNDNTEYRKDFEGNIIESGIGQ